MRGLLGWLTLALVTLCTTATAAARVERFAVIVGNNRGHVDETPLRYAEHDARRVAEVLMQLGNFAPTNVTVLEGADAATLRSSLITVNDRIRSVQSDPDTQAVLFVYYSGHADAAALHVGNADLPIAQLAQLVRGSAATFRLLVLDACRSGSVTRLKGGRVTEPFRLPEETALPGEGLAFLTASSADEDAQESDAIGGSFFTHALVSGLLGAADGDADGKVGLEEAFQYAYDGTLRATSRTAAGAQHPSFHYDLRGHGELVLTRPGMRDPGRSHLALPAGHGVLLLRDDSEGPVVAEVGAKDQARTLSLSPGRYFARARGTDVLYEGTLEVRAGSTQTLDVTQLSRIDYVRLVRKGGHSRSHAHGIELVGRVRSELPNADGACFGGGLGYTFVARQLSARLRLGYCQHRDANEHLQITARDIDAELRLAYTWDLRWLSVDLGLGGGAALLQQSFKAQGNAPNRSSVSPFGMVSMALWRELSGGYHVSLDLGTYAYWLRIQRPFGREQSEAAIAARVGLAIGRWF